MQVCVCKMKLLGFEQGNQIGHMDQVYYCPYLVKHSINTILMLPLKLCQLLALAVVISLFSFSSNSLNITK